MTVRELIERLSKMPPNAVVVYYDAENDEFFDTKEAKEISVVKTRERIGAFGDDCYHPNGDHWDKEQFAGRFDRVNVVVIN